MATFAEQGAIVKTNIPTMIGLGRLVDMVICDAQGQRQRVTPSSELWLAWKSDTRDLLVLRPGHDEGTRAQLGHARLHQMFHGAAPYQARPMQWPTLRGTVRTLGLIESVTYTAKGIHSPNKKSHRWIHMFGDRGERRNVQTSSNASSPYPVYLLPSLLSDAAGHLVIERRQGNRYDVRDWIIG